MEALVEVRDVVKRFARHGDESVLDDVSLVVHRGEIVALIGPSGCGKSTVLNIIAGLLNPTTGHVDISDPQLRIAYVFQRPRLLPWRNVQRNVEFLQSLGKYRFIDVRVSRLACGDYGEGALALPEEIVAGILACLPSAS